MSDAHDDHGHEDAGDDHHDHPFDGEPAKELGPGEPMTPGWLPMVGAALFVLGAIFFLTQREAGPADGAKPAAEPTPAAETVAQPQQPRPTLPVQARTAPVPPGPGGADNPIRKLSPDQVKDLQKRIQEAQQKRQEAGGKEAGGAKQ
ncbi:MAG: hypothetical protein R3B70_25395 [Polyangiaceae bacterium]